MGYGPKGNVAMKVRSFEAVKRDFGLKAPKGLVRHTLYYLAVGDRDSEYRFDFLGSAIYDFLCNPLVAEIDKLNLLGNLHKVVEADSALHRWRVGSLVNEHDLFHDWFFAPESTCKPSNNGMRTVDPYDACSGCGGFGLHSQDCKEF